ncbi:transient receptor potential cation channel subfamily M member 3-like [Porites lutea]|uniref:transient receptor potential cation channel subfamily M member 3-like n=1 Tax=Porites lutea TaxID=51062 RepID=UPI003CC506A3
MDLISSSLNHVIREKAESSPWVYETFKKKRCSRYIPCKKKPDRCGCGRSKASHGNETTDGQRNREHELTEPGQETSAIEWKVSEHTLIDGPTDAFGELEFTGAGQASRAKFIRISDDTDPDDVLHLLQKEWKLELPKLVISVTGGAKNFVMHPKLKDLFRQGLLKAAKTTGAWIITGGTNTGVMKHVGKAVKGHTVMSRGAMLTDKTSQVHLIGIAPWGIVEHRSELIKKTQDLVTYHMTSSLEIQGSCIDNNHSHFLLVDDGTEGKYGGEIAFRARFQKFLANKEISKRYNYLDENSQNDRPNGIPVVLVVLEGGPNTIRTVLESVTSTPAVPVVIADGSGRAADILAYAYSLYIEHEGFVFVLIMFFFLCLEAQITLPSYQLDLALTWNRADIARTEIFTKGRKWKIETLEDKMEDALINNRVEFVDLLLEKGVSMKKFLTTDRLNNLFKAVIRQGLPSRVVLEELIGNAKIDKVITFTDVIEALWPHLWGTYQGDDNKDRVVGTQLLQ